MSATVRQALLERPRHGPPTVGELARELGLREGHAAEHLAHAVRSLGGGARLVENPAQYLGCGFSFRKRNRLTAPGCSPRCRSERIRPAAFRVAPQ